MAVEFPELNSFGTLLRFAQALEQHAAEVAAEPAASQPAWAARLGACSKKHAKRVGRVDRMRRERLNEMTLQPLEGMARDDYLPADLPDGASTDQVLATVVAIEETVARFYTDAAEVGGDTLSGLGRTFGKLAKESLALADGLRG